MTARFLQGFLTDRKMDSPMITRRAALALPGLASPALAQGMTNIRFTLDHNDDVTIRIMDNLGREIRSETFRAVAGETTHRLDTRDLSCGIYTYLVETNQGSMGSRLMIER